MPSHAELTSKLLRDAATFFKTLASQNEPLKEQMTENANVFEQIADLLDQNPHGVIDGSTHAQLAARLMLDSATFFTTLAEQNEPIRDQMVENARVFGQMADLVENDPDGILE